MGMPHVANADHEKVHHYRMASSQKIHLCSSVDNAVAFAVATDTENYTAMMAQLMLMIGNNSCFETKGTVDQFTGFTVGGKNPYVIGVSMADGTTKYAILTQNMNGDLNDFVNDKIARRTVGGIIEYLFTPK